MQGGEDHPERAGNLCFSILIGSGGDASSNGEVARLSKSASFSILIGSGGDVSKLSEKYLSKKINVSVSSSDRVVMQEKYQQDLEVVIPKFQYPHRIGW